MASRDVNPVYENFPIDKATFKNVFESRGGRREEGSGWGTHVNLWRIHFDIWQI